MNACQTKHTIFAYQWLIYFQKTLHLFCNCYGEIRSIFKNLLTNTFVSLVSTIRRTSCTTSVCSGEVLMLPWSCRQEITLISSSTIARREPKLRHRPVPPLPRNSSRGTFARQNLFKEGRILIYKLINLLRS